MTKKQSWIPAAVYPCENRDGNDRGRLFKFLFSWGQAVIPAEAGIYNFKFLFIEVDKINHERL